MNEHGRPVRVYPEAPPRASDPGVCLARFRAACAKVPLSVDKNGAITIHLQVEPQSKYAAMAVTDVVGRWLNVEVYLPYQTGNDGIDMREFLEYEAQIIDIEEVDEWDGE